MGVGEGRTGERGRGEGRREDMRGGEGKREEEERKRGEEVLLCVHPWPTPASLMSKANIF